LWLWAGDPSISLLHQRYTPGPYFLVLPSEPSETYVLPSEPSESENMPAGYSSKCKSCNSAHRLKIEAWHKDGKSAEAIEILLKETYGEEISSRAIRNHINEHYNVPAEVQKQYHKSQVNLEKSANERVTEIQIIDDVVAGKRVLHQKLEKILTNRLKGLEDTEEPRDLPKLPQAYVTLYIGCASEIRQFLKTKQEILGEDSGTKKANAMETWVDLMLEGGDE
jgi:hypothetical protein